MNWTSHDDFRTLQQIGEQKRQNGELDGDTFFRLTNRMYELGREEMVMNEQQLVSELIEKLKSGEIRLADVIERLRT